MSTKPEYMEYVAEQMSDAGDITYKKMFGEYGVYLDGKIFGLVCDNQLYVKITEAGRALIPNAEIAPPYDGAKPYLLISDIDSKDRLADFIKATCKELPAPKKKK